MNKQTKLVLEQIFSYQNKKDIICKKKHETLHDYSIVTDMPTGKIFTDVPKPKESSKKEGIYFNPK